jgi:hypothetical protein
MIIPNSFINHPGVPSPRLLSPQRTVSLLRLCFTTRRQPLLRPSCGVPSFALADLTTALPVQYQSTPRRAIDSPSSAMPLPWLLSALPSRYCTSPHHRIGCPYPSGPRSAIATLVFAISVLRRSVLCRTTAVPCFSVPRRFQATLCLCQHLNPNPCLFGASHCHYYSIQFGTAPCPGRSVQYLSLSPQHFARARLCFALAVHVCSLPVPIWSALCLCRVFDEFPVETTFTGIPPLTKSVKNSIVHDLGDQVFDPHPGLPDVDHINR